MQRYTVGSEITNNYRLIGGVDEFDVWVWCSPRPNGSRWEVMLNTDRGRYVGFDLRTPGPDTFHAACTYDDIRTTQQVSREQSSHVKHDVPRDKLQRILLLIQCFAPILWAAGDIYPELRGLLDTESDVRPEPNKED